MRTIFNNLQLQFIKENYKNMTYLEMSRVNIFNGLTEKQIRNKARNMGLSKIRKFNDDYFKKIDTPQKAYWLGFIYADGYVVYDLENGTYELGIEIHKNDSDLLYKLNSQLGDKHCVTYKSRSNKFNGYRYISEICSLRVYSKKVCEDLISHNVKPNKTYLDEFPVVEEELQSHFIRGFFDGDGSVSYNNRRFLQVSFTNANNHLLEYIKETIHNELGIMGSIYYEKENKYRLMFFRKSDVIELLTYIYNQSDDLRLEKKYSIFYNYIWPSQLEMIG